MAPDENKNLLVDDSAEESLEDLSSYLEAIAAIFEALLEDKIN